MTAVDVNTFRPATDLLIGSLRETIGQIQGHQHPERGGDLFCLNLTSFMGERMGPVLARLADAQAETESWKDRHTALADEFAAEVERLRAALIEIAGMCTCGADEHCPSTVAARALASGTGDEPEDDE